MSNSNPTSVAAANALSGERSFATVQFDKMSAAAEFHAIISTLRSQTGDWMTKRLVDWIILNHRLHIKKLESRCRRITRHRKRRRYLTQLRRAKRELMALTLSR